MEGTRHGDLVAIAIYASSVVSLMLMILEITRKKANIFMYFLYLEIVVISGGKCRNYIHIDWNKVITNHELTITPRCLMDRTRSLYSGYKGKSKFWSALKKCPDVNFSTSLS